MVETRPSLRSTVCRSFCYCGVSFALRRSNDDEEWRGFGGSQKRKWVVDWYARSQIENTNKPCAITSINTSTGWVSLRRSTACCYSSCSMRGQDLTSARGGYIIIQCSPSCSLLLYQFSFTRVYIVGIRLCRTYKAHTNWVKPALWRVHTWVAGVRLPDPPTVRYCNQRATTKLFGHEQGLYTDTKRPRCRFISATGSDRMRVYAWERRIKNIPDRFSMWWSWIHIAHVCLLMVSNVWNYGMWGERENMNNGETERFLWRMRPANPWIYASEETNGVIIVH